MPAPKKVTDEQVIAAMAEHGTQRAAARALGVNQSAISVRLRRLEARGYSPKHDMIRPVPESFIAGGVSTYYNKDGKPVGQWVKARLDLDRARRLIDEAVAAMAEDLPRVKRVSPPGVVDRDLLNCYVITDYHLGMLSWHEETGADWDTAIAEDALVRWFGAAIAAAPKADTAVFAQLGDFLHFDSLDSVTPTSKHVLDADTRFAKLVRASIRAIRKIVSMLLEKHKRVHIIMAEGNHDLAASVWLREMFAAIYADEPRITVDQNPDPYYCYEWGETALFFHHGHKRKPANVDTVFAAKFREIFGRTKHAYAHMGHLHHVDQRETNLMVVEQHRTLAAPDAYASRGGWMSGRDAQVISYSRRFGEVGRLKISDKMLGLSE